MSTPEEKAEMLRKQVVAKVHWGDSEQEVRDWLREERGITGEEADRLFSIAEKERRKSIRSRAVLMLIFSGAFIAITIGYFVVQIRGNFVLYGKSVMVFLGVGCTSVLCFIRSLARLVSGKSDAPID